MKKSIAMLLIAALTLAITGCAEGNRPIEPAEEEIVQTEETTAATTTEKTTATEKAEETTRVARATEPAVTEPPEPTFPRLNSADYPLSMRSNPIYEVERFLDDVDPPPGAGAIRSYDELVESIHQEDGTMNFVKYEIIGIYTSKEVETITDGRLNGDHTTLYKARIIYDYLNQREVNIEINLAKAGTPTLQSRGNPQYAIGDVYVSILPYLDGFLDKTRTRVSGSMLNFAFHKINGVEFAYHINYDYIKIENTSRSINIGVLSSERSFVTTTRNNPVKYTQKFSVDELADFFRNDWKQRGFKFLDLSKFDGFRV